MTTTTGTSTSGTSLVTALGAGSGIDMTALANNLATAQFSLRTSRLTTKAETLDRRISAASTIRGMLSNLSSSLGARVRSGDLSPQPQVSNAAVAKASLSGSATPSGSYSLEVTKLATAQALKSPAYASSAATVGAGTLTLRFGTVAGATFTEDTSHAVVSVDMAAGATLADVAAAINGKRAGVTAYVANTTTGATLMLKGSEGTANGFIVEATGDPGITALAWTPAGDASRLLASAGDAAYSIDGLPMTGPSNTVTDAIPGLNLMLTATNAGAPTTVTFADPTSAITTAMQDLTDALNEVGGELLKATDAKTGDLARDSGALALKRAFASLAGKEVMPGVADGTPSTLADLGLSTQRDGTFVLDTQRLSATLKADPKGAAAMFTNGLFGVYATIDGLVRSATKSTDPGTLAGSISRYNSQKTTVTEEQTKLTEQQEALRARLASRFAVSDSRVGTSKSTLSFLQNQIDMWTSSNN